MDGGPANTPVKDVSEISPNCVTFASVVSLGTEFFFKGPGKVGPGGLWGCTWAHFGTGFSKSERGRRGGRTPYPGTQEWGDGTPSNHANGQAKLCLIFRPGRILRPLTHELCFVPVVKEITAACLFDPPPFQHAVPFQGGLLRQQLLQPLLLQPEEVGQHRNVVSQPVCNRCLGLQGALWRNNPNSMENKDKPLW